MVHLLLNFITQDYQGLYQSIIWCNYSNYVLFILPLLAARSTWLATETCHNFIATK